MSVYNVFTDFHHSSLLNSLIMLFEGRLEGQVYRPIGLEWYEQGFWRVFDHPETVKQYLSLDQGYRPVDSTPPLNMLEEVTSPQLDQAEVYYCRDIESNKLNKAITLETFKHLPIDIVIASLPQHIEPFKRLIKEYKPQAKLIYQVGNSWDSDYDINNMMASAVVPMANVPNFIQYHQEFDVNLFKPEPKAWANVTSFINCYDQFRDWPLFLEVERLMPKWDFYSYGGQCRNGSIQGSKALAKTIQDTGFVWHVKAGGDGYGHILFNAAACGKPIITNGSDYVGKLGEKLLTPGVTCIDVQGLSASDIRVAIEFYSEPRRYAQMSHNMLARFKEVVNFDREFIQLKQFLERLI